MTPWKKKHVGIAYELLCIFESAHSGPHHGCGSANGSTKRPKIPVLRETCKTAR